MNLTLIKAFTSQLSPLDETAWGAFEQYLSVQKISKGEDLWSTGEVCKHVVFINKGLIRVYYISLENGEETTVQFLFENRYLTDYYSLITQQPCQYFYTALEQCELISIPRVALYEMYDRFKYFERFGRLMAEQSYLLQQRVLFNLKSISPEEKYLNLIKERPKVLQRVPLKLIASYLGMSPEHLSRLRKKISQ